MIQSTKILCPEFLDFIRQKPCAACGRIGPSDPDHLSARGMGSGKRNDFLCLPLCRNCHVERGYGNEKFEAKWRINLWQQVTMNVVEFFAMDEERRCESIIRVSSKVVQGPWEGTWKTRP